jgi:hypothetical protein
MLPNTSDIQGTELGARMVAEEAGVTARGAGGPVDNSPVVLQQ